MTWRAAVAIAWLCLAACTGDDRPATDASVPDARSEPLPRPDAGVRDPDVRRDVATYLRTYTEGQLVATYPTLVDIRSNLVDDGRYAAIKTAYARAAPILRAFVKDHVRARAEESAAFLAVDFVAGRAFYKLTNDRTGRTVRLAGWDRDALDVTRLIDEFLEDNSALAIKQDLVASGRIPLDGAFASLRSQKDNPFIFDAQLARYTAALKRQVASDSGRQQLDDLKRQAPGLHDDIRAVVEHVSERDLQQIQEFAPPRRVKERFDRVIKGP